MSHVTLCVAMLCITCIVCTWLIAERWYVHRDRALQALRASAEASSKLVREQCLAEMRGLRETYEIALREIRANANLAREPMDKLRADHEELARAVKLRIVRGS